MTRALLFACIAIAGCSDAATTTTDDAGTNPLDLATAPDQASTPDLAPACGAGLYLGGPQHNQVSAACSACARKSCCTELTACAADPACVATRTCFATCQSPDDFPCFTKCRADNGNPKSASDVAGCRNKSCAAECADFSCQGKVTWPQPSKPSVTLALTFFDYLSGSPLPGATVKVCPIADAACASPISTQMTDAKGVLMLTVPTAPGGLAAYFETTAAGHPTTLSYFVEPVDVALDGLSRGIPIIATDSITVLSGVAGQSQEPMKALVLFRAWQCSEYDAPGLTVAGDTGTTVYLAGGLPSASATQTDGSGSGAIFNVAPGTATITSSYGGKPYGKQSVTTRAGAVTALNVVPTP